MKCPVTSGRHQFHGVCGYYTATLEATVLRRVSTVIIHLDTN